MNSFELIVIGGGPSGSLTGYHAARLGLRVLILEKKEFPRVKPCGGGLTLRALRYLPFPIDHLVKHYDRRVLFSVNHSEMIECVAPEFFSVQIIRSQFDTYLLEQAREAGAQTKVEEVVGIATEDNFTVTTAARSYHSRYLVIADGSNGTSKKLLGMAKSGRTGAALEGDILRKDLPDKEIKLEFYFNAYRSSYAWIFPKNDKDDRGGGHFGEAHVNVGIYTYDTERLSLSRESLYRLVRDRFRLEPEAIQNLRGYPLNFDYGAGHPHPNLIMVGDAAGFPDPLWGEGLYHAFKSAHLAGEAFRKVGGKKLSHVYRHLCKDIVTDLRFCHSLADRFNRHPSWGNLFVHMPFLKKIFTQVMISGRPTYHILNRFYSLPFWTSARQDSVRG